MERFHRSECVRAAAGKFGGGGTEARGGGDREAQRAHEGHSFGDKIACVDVSDARSKSKRSRCRVLCE